MPRNPEKDPEIPEDQDGEMDADEGLQQESMSEYAPEQGQIAASLEFDGEEAVDSPKKKGKKRKAKGAEGDGKAKKARKRKGKKVAEDEIDGELVDELADTTVEDQGLAYEDDVDEGALQIDEPEYAPNEKPKKKRKGREKKASLAAMEAAADEDSLPIDDDADYDTPEKPKKPKRKPKEKKDPSELKNSIELCAEFGIPLIEMEYTDEDYTTLMSYKLFMQHIRPLIAKENPKMASPKVIQLVGALWREFVAGHPNKEQLEKNTGRKAKGAEELEVVESEEGTPTSTKGKKKSKGKTVAPLKIKIQKKGKGKKKKVPTATLR